MSRSSTRIPGFLLMLCLLCLQKASAQEKKEKNNGDISTEVVAHDRDAIFSSSAYFTFSVNNPTGKDQAGTVSYIVTTEKGEKVADKVQSVKISQNSNENYDFHLPELKTGFYKINFMINVTDYDDTTRRAFGIRPQEIRATTAKPADFDQFWKNTKAELAKVAPNFKITPVSKKNTDNREVYQFQMQSLDNYTVRGYLTIPKTKNKNRKFAV
ncbi:MAG: acetylxylan esterase, partial [Mucilaginibacter sp.]